MGARVGRWIAIGVALAAAAGCAAVGADLPYYWQSARGHLALMRQARPIVELLQDGAVDAGLRPRLERALQIREFASRELALPDNGSYTRYADLGRPFVVWNVFATPELSMTLRQWCFPVAGCVNYRGYFEREVAERYAAELRADGWEVHLAGVPAYSTLGWFDDPVLSTFIRYPEGELARLLFHELSHQVVYLKGDSTFNESFATAVEEAGVERWLAARGDAQLDAAYRQFAQRRREFVALLIRHKKALEAVYAESADDAARRAGKAAVFAALQSEYRDLKASWGGWSGYDRWFAQPLTNAHLASVATYNALVPAFRGLLSAQGGDLPRFYDSVRALARLPKAERERRLAEASRDGPRAMTIDDGGGGR
jgi:predicted aminopeptidase